MFKKCNENVRTQIDLNVQEKSSTLKASLVLSEWTSKAVSEKLASTYQEENIQLNVNLKHKLHKLRHIKNKNLQKHFTELKETALDLTKLNDLVQIKDEIRGLLRSTPNYIDFILLISDLNNMDYNSIWALWNPSWSKKKLFHGL